MNIKSNRNYISPLTAWLKFPMLTCIDDSHIIDASYITHCKMYWKIYMNTASKNEAHNIKLSRMFNPTIAKTNNSFC